MLVNIGKVLLKVDGEPVTQGVNKQVIKEKTNEDGEVIKYHTVETSYAEVTLGYVMTVAIMFGSDLRSPEKEEELLRNLEIFRKIVAKELAGENEIELTKEELEIIKDRIHKAYDDNFMVAQIIEMLNQYLK